MDEEDLCSYTVYAKCEAFALFLWLIIPFCDIGWKTVNQNQGDRIVTLKDFKK